jgi:uncharacterized DUF497 family protein
MAPEFEWDAKKAEENVKEHGVAFEEALTTRERRDYEQKSQKNSAT